MSLHGPRLVTSSEDKDAVHVVLHLYSLPNNHVLASLYLHLVLFQYQNKNKVFTPNGDHFW